MQKSRPMWFKITHLAQRKFLGKLNNIIFAYLLSPFILLHLKQVLRADPKILGCIVLIQIGSDFSIYPERRFHFIDINFVYLVYPIIIQYHRI